jgi:ADP-ribosyl-[dinitrogen reductase] hydrolase
MPEQTRQAREDQFLGALLGLAIGDALGKPVNGLGAKEIASRFGEVTTYLPVETAEPNRPALGEISDVTEVVLCIVESLTTNDGLVDPVNINARMGFLAAGPSRETMSHPTIDGIELAATRDGFVPDSDDEEYELAVAARGVPVGLLHAVGGRDGDSLKMDAVRLARLTHGGAYQGQATAEVAVAIHDLGRTRSASPSESQTSELRELIEIAVSAGSFLAGVTTAIGRGGDAAAAGAIAGAMLGTRLGASAIPQPLIDGLDTRIYMTMAAPWFYRTAVRRAGTVVDLRHIT